MKKVTVSLEQRHLDQLDEWQKNNGAGSRAAAVRQIFDDYEQLHTECEELHTECENLRERLGSREDRIEELEEQLARRSQVEEKVDVLAKRVEEGDEPDPPWPIRWYRYFRGDE